LIDNNTDYCIGTLYSHNDFDIRQTSEVLGKPLIASKTHFPTNGKCLPSNKFTSVGKNHGNNFANSKLAVLIRNPHDTLKSQLLLHSKVPHSLIDDYIDIFCEDWNKWISYYEKVECVDKRFYTYEQLSIHCYDTVCDICEYLNIEVKDNFKNVDRKESVRRVLSARCRNPKFIGECKILNYKSFFSPDQCKRIYQLCKRNITNYFSFLEEYDN
jgi:hypothetical protein